MEGLPNGRFLKTFDTLGNKYHVYPADVLKELHDLLHLYSQNDKAYPTLVASKGGKENLIVLEQADTEQLGGKSYC